MEDLIIQLRKVGEEVRKLKSDLHEAHLLLEKREREIERLKEEKLQWEMEHRKLAEESKYLKMQRVMEGDGAYTKLVRHQLNKLIKEIDTCITDLHHRGL